MSLRRGQVRTARRACGGTGSAEPRGDNRSLGTRFPCGPTSDFRDSDHFGLHSRPDWTGPCRKPARPGGNVTGVSALSADYVAKSLELLKQADPRISRVGVIGDLRNPTYAIYQRELGPAGRALGVALDFEPVNALSDIEPALSAVQKRGANAVLVMHQPFTFQHRQHIVQVVNRYRLPAVYGSQEAVELGGLISYTVSVSDVFRRAAFYVDKILNGVKPADLPVEQPTKFKLVINLKTANALGHTVSPLLLARADDVIE